MKDIDCLLLFVRCIFRVTSQINVHNVKEVIVKEALVGIVKEDSTKVDSIRAVSTKAAMVVVLTKVETAAASTKVDSTNVLQAAA